MKPCFEPFDMKKRSLFITQAAIIAAVYVVLTVTLSAFNLASGGVQIRISEALTVLPFFTPAAIPGLSVGCLLSNIITGCLPWDIVFGSLATLIGAIGTYLLRKVRWLAPVPPILSNTLIIPFVLQYVYGIEGSVWLFMAGVGIGEVISCGIFGMLLLHVLKKHRNILF